MVFGFKVLESGEYKIKNWRNLNKYEEKILSEFKQRSDNLIHDFEEYINNLDWIEIDNNLANELFNMYLQNFHDLSFLKQLIEDQNIEEISIIENNVVRVYYKGKGWLDTNIYVYDPNFIINLINFLAKETNRRITLKNPRINASYKNFRIHGVIKPIVESNCITIRRFNKKIFYPDEIIKFGTITSFELAFLWCCMLSEINILICGNTGSGKTTTLNILANMINPKERIILVEETPEMNLRQKHVVRLISNHDLGISMKDLILDTLRMRPDRVILSEIRSKEETSAFIETLLSGQGKASYTTYHAQSFEECITRLEKQGVSKQDINTLDIVVIQRRYTTKKGEFRKVFGIYHVKTKNRINENNIPKEIKEKLDTYFEGNFKEEFKKRRDFLEKKDFCDTYEIDKFSI